MPLKMANELRFSMGAPIPLPDTAVQDLLNLAKRVSLEQGEQAVIEVLKQQLCKASGTNYSRSSSLSWAHTDLDMAARNASTDAPNFIAAICDALEALESSGACVPTPLNINQILAKHRCDYTIQDNELIVSNGQVPTPIVKESEADIVKRALADANALIGQTGAPNALDRAQLALHGYLRNLCKEFGIALKDDATTATAFFELRKAHPKLQATGNRANDISIIIKSCASIVDCSAPLRNKASMAHDNELLDVPEARLAINAMYILFTYIQDRMRS